MFIGGHAIILSAKPELKVKAAIAQCPYTGYGSPPIPYSFTFLKTVSFALLDYVSLKVLRKAGKFIDTIAEPGHVGALVGKGYLKESAYVFGEER